jgi:hypothetical protein
MKRSTLIFIAAIIVATAILSIAIPKIFLGNTIKQEGDESLIPTIAENISDPTSSTPLLQEGSDFTVSSERYFSGKQWLVVTVSPIKESAADPAVIVLQLKDSKYVTVIGPGTAFDESDLTILPSDVTQYLKSLGRVNTSI